MKLSPSHIRSFQHNVFAYYKKYGRDLPWRKTTNPYYILLSEIMLQQTQVDRVIQYYHRWTTKWPHVVDLARADRREVLQEWMGLGYNNRAINIHKAAQKIIESYNGDVIAAMKNYKDIPGVGPYISHAVRIFSGNEDTVTVDTNIRRILIHEFHLHKKISDNELWDIAEHCLPKGKSRDWHNALMDYGATLLTSRKTGIRPKTQQSPFEGSDRQIRAQIIRHLLNNVSVEFSEICSRFSIEKNRLDKIIYSLIKDGLVFRDKEVIRLKV